MQSWMISGRKSPSGPKGLIFRFLLQCHFFKRTSLIRLLRAAPRPLCLVPCSVRPRLLLTPRLQPQSVLSLLSAREDRHSVGLVH